MCARRTGAVHAATVQSCLVGADSTVHTCLVSQVPLWHSTGLWPHLQQQHLPRPTAASCSTFSKAPSATKIAHCSSSEWEQRHQRSEQQQQQQAPAAVAAEAAAAMAAAGLVPCPPCPVPVQVGCLGGHCQQALPCRPAAAFCCGAPCGRPLACGNHNCSKACHAVSAAAAAECEVCERPCGKPRSCSHPCPSSCCTRVPVNLARWLWHWTATVVRL